MPFNPHPLLLCLPALAGLRYMLRSDWYKSFERRLNARAEKWLTLLIGALLVLMYWGAVAGALYSINPRVFDR